MFNITRRESIIIRYLYDALQKKPIVGVTEVAKKFNIRPTTAYEILMRLVTKNILKHIERKGFVFTEEGKRLAVALVFSHRVVEIVLHRIFGMSPSCACEIASHIDYLIEVNYAIKAFKKLDAPKKCPHDKELPLIENFIGEFNA